MHAGRAFLAPVFVKAVRRYALTGDVFRLSVMDRDAALGADNFKHVGEFGAAFATERM